MALQLIRNNIINVVADAIVNTANPAVAVGPGVDEAIYTAAGWDRLLEARSAIGPMKPGEVACTPAFDLEAKYIIHAIGPAWRGGGYGERETVAECYRKSLTLARELGCESIAFPLMATGTYGFPKDEALTIAIREITGFLAGNEMEVLLVVYDRESFAVSGRLFSDIREYIEDSDVTEMAGAAVSEESLRDQGAYNRRATGRGNRRGRVLNRRTRREETPEEDTAYFEPILMSNTVEMTKLYEPSGDSIEERLRNMDKTFQQYLFMLIDRKGMEDTEVYKKANIDRKHFSKIKSNINYSPSKKTAVAFAIALRLSMDETKDLLMRAGLALSPASMFDQIIAYCIEHGEYDIFEINNILFTYEQPTLGA